MIKFVGYAVSFACGTVIGGLISHFITKKKLTKECLDKIEVMHSYYEEEYGHIDIPKETSKETEKTITEEVIETKRSGEPIVKKTDISEYKDYTQYYNVVDPAEGEHPTDDEDFVNYSQGDYLTREIKAERDANASKPPKIIKIEDCGSDPAYRTINLNYYTGDGVLVECGGEFYYGQDDIDILTDMIGDALDKYGFRENDEDEICVRNFSYMIDYDIVKIDGYYSDLVGEKGV